MPAHLTPVPTSSPVFFRGNAGGKDVDEEKRVAAWTALFEQKHEEAMHGAKERAAAAAKLAAGVTVTRH